jgi:hypothetical protein
MLIASVLLLASAVSAYTIASPYSNLTVKINGDIVDGTTLNPLPTVNAGDTLTIQANFKYIGTSDDNIKVKATLEGSSNDVTATTSSFDVEVGSSYVKTLTLKVPSDFESDSLNASFPLTVKIGDAEVSLGNVEVQRPSYDVTIKSVIASSTAQAGTSVPVEVVLKNDGYNDLNDMYVTVKVAELGIEKQVYFGDLYNVADTTTDNKDSIRGTLNLDIPSTAKAGKYTLTVVASNDDTTSTATQDLTVTNSITDLAMKSGTDLVLLNPTNQLVVYTIKYNTETDAVIIPAASSKTVAINVPTSGDYKFDVSVYSGDTLLDTVNYTGTADTTQVTSPVFVLTVILAIVFLVLLVVLVVLITKKPQKTEEFGESYY